ncbi:MAG: hypothetical protein HXY25_10120, partial [Alphaproteobacteria bacterium]|nr:hypothetical protein [Alphaproteobacteria bacterium]
MSARALRSRPSRPASPGAGEAGFALPLVLFFGALLALLLLPQADSRRAALDEAAALMDRVRTDAALEGAIHREIADLLATGAEDRLVAGTWAEETVGETRVRVRSIDLSGRVDLNRAPAPLLARLLEGVDGRPGAAARARA